MEHISKVQMTGDTRKNLSQQPKIIKKIEKNQL
jgi:hypothetical protein